MEKICLKNRWIFLLWEMRSESSNVAVAKTAILSFDGHQTWLRVPCSHHVFLRGFFCILLQRFAFLCLTWFWRAHCIKSDGLSEHRRERGDPKLPWQLFALNKAIDARLPIFTYISWMQWLYFSMGRTDFCIIFE